MAGIEKRIRGATGETRVAGMVSMPFDVEDLQLRYRFPFQGVVDSLEPDDGGFLGRTTLAARARPPCAAAARSRPSGSATS